jgi:hypothetical protein
LLTECVFSEIYENPPSLKFIVGDTALKGRGAGHNRESKEDGGEELSEHGDNLNEEGLALSAKMKW